MVVGRSLNAGHWMRRRPRTQAKGASALGVLSHPLAPEGKDRSGDKFRDSGCRRETLSNLRR